MSSKKITIGITGTTGHLGTSIIPLLESKEYKVRALQYNCDLPFSLKNAEIIRGSLFDLPSLNELVIGCDVVIHCAAKISINSNKDTSVYDTNVNGTKNIFNAAKEANVKKFIYISSIHAYNQVPVDEILNESRLYCDNSSALYDQSKRDAQKFVLNQETGSMETVVLNPTSVIGPHDYKPSLMGKAIIELYNGNIPSLVRGGFDFCDVRDVAEGIVSAIENGRNGHGYLLSGKWCSLSDLNQTIIDVKGSTRRIPTLPPWLAYLGLPFINMMAFLKKTEPLYTKESLDTLINGNKNISSLKATQELGYTNRPLSETILDSINWFKQEGYLK